MIAIIFEVVPHPDQRGAYLDLAAAMRPQLEAMDGFISVERFESLTTPGKMLSLSYWRDEAAVARWRNLDAHRRVQAKGRAHIFADYRLRVAAVLRDYGSTIAPRRPRIRGRRTASGQRRRSFAARLVRARRATSA